MLCHLFFHTVFGAVCFCASLLLCDGFRVRRPAFTDFLHIFLFLIVFESKSWHLTSSSYCWMAAILLLLWWWSFSVYSFPAVSPHSITSPPFHRLFSLFVFLCVIIFPCFCLVSMLSPISSLLTSYLHTHTCPQTMINIYWYPKKQMQKQKCRAHYKNYEPAHVNTHRNTLPLIASLPVGASVLSVGGAAALPYIFTTTVTTIISTAATVVCRFCASALVAHLSLCSATIHNPVTQLSSSRSSHHCHCFAKLIAAIKEGIGGIIHLNSVLMLCFKVPWKCGNFRSVSWARKMESRR